MPLLIFGAGFDQASPTGVLDAPTVSEGMRVQCSHDHIKASNKRLLSLCFDTYDHNVLAISELRSLGQERDERSSRTLEEASILEASLAEAKSVRDLAGDSVRRLDPVATAARNSERGETVLPNLPCPQPDLAEP